MKSQHFSQQLHYIRQSPFSPFHFICSIAFNICLRVVHHKSLYLCLKTFHRVSYNISYHVMQHIISFNLSYLSTYHTIQYIVSQNISYHIKCGFRMNSDSHRSGGFRCFDPIIRHGRWGGRRNDREPKENDENVRMTL